MRVVGKSNGAIAGLESGAVQQWSEDCVECCAEVFPPFVGCGTDCDYGDPWWPGTATARLQASFSGVDLSSASNGPSFSTLQQVAEDPSTYGLVAGTSAWLVGGGDVWFQFNGATRPAGFIDRSHDNSACCPASGTVTTTMVCNQAADRYNVGSTWTTGGATFGSEDADVTRTFTCKTRADSGSCVPLSWSKNTFKAVPYAYPECWSSITSVVASVNSFIIPGGTGTDGLCSITFPVVGGVQKIRIECRTALSLRVNGANTYYIKGLDASCVEASNGPFAPAVGLWKYAYWFFYEGDPPAGFPCKKASWTFPNQLVKGWQTSSPTASWSITGFGSVGCASTVTTTCNTPHLGQFNIGSGGTCTISMTSDGCNTAPERLILNIPCTSSGGSPGTWDGPLTMDVFTVSVFDPTIYYYGETALYKATYTWSAGTWSLEVRRKSGNTFAASGSRSGAEDDPVGTFSPGSTGALWSGGCTFQFIITAAP